VAGAGIGDVDVADQQAGAFGGCGVERIDDGQGRLDQQLKNGYSAEPAIDQASCSTAAGTE